MSEQQNTILGIDVGNSSIHWAFIKDGIMSSHERNKHTELSLLPWDEVKGKNVPVVIAGAIVHINDAIHEITNDHNIRFIEIEAKKQNMIKNTYSTLGADRVCNLIGAIKHFKNPTVPVVVFDFGTATTITACDEYAGFLGGIIKTGFEVELKAISSKTLSLPHVELAKEQKILELNPLTTNTEDAILHGVIFGQMSLIKYYLDLFKSKVNKIPKTVLTGGNASIINKFYKDFDLFDPHLTLKGIYHCYKSMVLQKV